MAQNMGMGQLALGNVVFKRKFRWTFKVDDFCNGTEIPEHFVKLASRPNLSIEETEINFLNGKMWIPGKGSWETITVTYYDVAGTDGGDMASVYTWIATIYNFLDSTTLTQSSKRADYGGRGTLTLFDGCGTPMEEWTLRHMWPQAINFGELDYSSSEECTVELTLRYSEVDYVNMCGADPEACCEGC